MATASRILVVGCRDTDVDLLRDVVSDLACNVETVHVNDDAPLYDATNAVANQSFDTQLGNLSAGDTIYVATGIYTGTGTEVVLLDKDITLSGGWNSAFSVQTSGSTVDAEGERMGIKSQSHQSTIENFLILSICTSITFSDIVYKIIIPIQKPI